MQCDAPLTASAPATIAHGEDYATSLDEGTQKEEAAKAESGVHRSPPQFGSETFDYLALQKHPIDCGDILVDRSLQVNSVPLGLIEGAAPTLVDVCPALTDSVFCTGCHQ